jgi:Putative beta barrel porin-7 (BBP7)
MRMLSGMHWLTVGLALLVSAQGFGTKKAKAQPPMMGEAPTSMAMPGPAPIGCDAKVPDDGQGLFGTGMLRGPFGSRFGGGGGDCGAYGCGPYAGSGYGYGTSGCGSGLGAGDGGLLEGGLLGCRDGACRGNGPLGGRLAGAVGGVFGSSSLFSGGILRRVLGPIAPYTDGQGSQRWFDVSAGTLAFARKSGYGQIGSTQQVFATGQYLTTDVISSIGTGTAAVPPATAADPGTPAQPGTPALLTSGLDFDKLRYGLELIGNIQTGPGANVEVRYFGLNKWSDSRSVRRTTPDLYSVFSSWGTDPVGGYDDTDRSLIHKIAYTSKFDNGEVNYRRRWMGYHPSIQGSWLGGVRYFVLDEKFGFGAIGSNNNTFTADQLRFFNMETRVANHMVGAQIGADLWANIIPGIAIGTELKGGVYNNNVDVTTDIVSNSVQQARERLEKDRAAFLVEFNAQAVYRLSYSWSLRGGYNLLYVDKVALAPNNFNPRVTASATTTGGVDFGINRDPYVDAKSHAFYSGFSFGGEFLW